MLEGVVDAGANRILMHRIREKSPIRSTHQRLQAHIGLPALSQSRHNPAKAGAASLKVPGTALGRSVLLCPSSQLFSPRPIALNSELRLGWMETQLVKYTAIALVDPPERGKDVRIGCLDSEAAVPGWVLQ